MADEFVIDTDALNLFFRGDEEAVQVLARLKIKQLSSTVISADEIVSGWQTLLRKVKNNAQEADVWRRYTISLNLMRSVQWLPFPEAAIERFETLKKMRLNVGNNDLRIAAIALENGATVVTRNVRDFRRVPELQVARWSEDDTDGQEDI
jgi:tRNA(fMet)-specific endonuclease VapC